jgi:coproporphyrinogen III oxidase
MPTGDQILDFLKDTRNRFDAFCKQFNPESEVEETNYDCPLGPLQQVAISRGKVLEKASCTLCDLEVDTPPVLYEQMDEKIPKMRALCLEATFFPSNPKVPKTYLELRANIAGDVILAGGTDIFPYFPSQDDHDLMATRIKALCTEHGQDYQAMQKTRAEFFKSSYRKQAVGSHAGIYSFSLPDNSFDFFTAMADAYFKVSEELVNIHKDDPSTPDDLALQKKFHGQWAQWIMLEDEGTLWGLRKGIPIDALLGAILPPVCTY